MFFRNMVEIETLDDPVSVSDSTPGSASGPDFASKLTGVGLESGLVFFRVVRVETVVSRGGSTIAGFSGVDLLLTLRLEYPRRYTLPMTALRVVPPSVSAILPALLPSSHMDIRVLTRSSVQYFIVISLFIRKGTRIVRPLKSRGTGNLPHSIESTDCNSHNTSWANTPWWRRKQPRLASSSDDDGRRQGRNSRISLARFAGALSPARVNEATGRAGPAAFRRDAGLTRGSGSV